MFLNEKLRELIRGLHAEMILGNTHVRLGADQSGHLVANPHTPNTSVAVRIVGDPKELQELFGQGSSFSMTARYGDEKSRGEIKF